MQAMLLPSVRTHAETRRVVSGGAVRLWPLGCLAAAWLRWLLGCVAAALCTHTCAALLLAEVAGDVLLPTRHLLAQDVEEEGVDVVVEGLWGRV